MYKAKIEIGGYNVGDEVPKEKALVWIEMYKKSPVEKIEDEVPLINPKKEDDVAEVESEKSNVMHDDYLNRNTHVVIKAIKDDKLEKDVLMDLMEIELVNKKRKPVINIIKLKLKK